MYVVTFYSFKGGVGRSMALVNVGVQLAQAGKKVLLVDFDLEAPGLPTFSLERPLRDSRGVVDFITQYVETEEAPDIKDYLYQSTQFAGGGGLWVMPVGQQDEGYAKRLNTIDWRLLYAEQDGYLFFEDMRRQWESAIAPDYVLIDSRTGHSDVEGLCTRQLPNAVCLLFFPNEQNLQGLRRIVHNIRHENARLMSPKRSIALHFVVSNVPDLDDEDQILGRTMSRFQSELGYEALAGEIHHYNSLSLLNQEIFSLGRPNSRLTKEYRELARSITKINLSDRDSAVGLLKSAYTDIAEIATSTGPEKLSGQLDAILKTFAADGEILFLAARVYIHLGNVSDALSLLSSEVVAKNYATAAMFATRAGLRRRAGHTEEAKEDLVQMFNASGSDFESFLRVLNELNQLDPSLYERIPDSVAFRSLPPNDRVFLAFQFEGGPSQLNAKVRVLQEMAAQPPADLHLPAGDLEHEISLALIAQGSSAAAIKYLKPLAEAKPPSISAAFNLAMALWGRDGKPSSAAFQNVAVLHEARGSAFDDANYAQCLAIVHGVLGNKEKAQRFLREARQRTVARPKREISGWSYTKVPPKEFISHLDEIQLLLDGKAVRPRFMTQDRSLFDSPTLH
jgi:MinD-like ATPase involved in chromosome partitioning or flagellar assembly